MTRAGLTSSGPRRLASPRRGNAFVAGDVADSNSVLAANERNSMIKLKDKTVQSAINPRLVELVVEKKDGTVRAWIRDDEYILDMTFEDVTAAVDKANS